MNTRDQLFMQENMALVKIMDEGWRGAEGPAHNNPYAKFTLEHRAWCIGWSEDFYPREGYPAARPHAAYFRSDILYHGDIFGGNR
jgi:hypothetical protein